MKFKWIIFLLIVSLLMCAAPVSAAPTVNLDGRQLSFDVPPTIKNGHTLVPLRAIFEAMGATVQWDQNTQTATAIKGATRVVVIIGSKSPTINGVVKTIDVPAQIIHGRTFAPLRFVCEAFGGSVGWNGATETAYITTTAVTQGKSGMNNLDPLLIAAVKNNDSVQVEELLKLGASPNTIEQRPEGYNSTPLIFVPSSTDQKEIMNLLIRYGANVNLTDDLGNTALHMASANGCKNVAQILISCGADIDARGFKGRTPLMMASFLDEYDIASLLLLNGANPKIVCYEGLTAWDYAINDGHLEIAELIARFLRNM